MCHHITPTTDQFLTEAWDDDTTSFDEHFPTAPLDDDAWAEEQILDRCLCIHGRPDEPNHQCSYPCPYDSNTTFLMDLLQSMQQNEAVFNYDLIDFNDISSNLSDIMMMTSDADIPYFDDVSDAVWFTYTFSVLELFSCTEHSFCCQRQAFKLTELFIMSEDNQVTMSLYVLLN